MRHLTIPMLCFLTLLTGAAQAADVPACTVPAPATKVVSVAQLPPDVQSLLQSNGPVSDPGGPFNASDVMADAAHPVPGQRLLSGQAGTDLICLRVEQGGRGVHHAIMRFERHGEQWTLVSQANVAPESPD